MVRLLEYYKADVVKKLQSHFKYSNIMEVPKITKIVISTSIGEATQDKKKLLAPLEELALISGQKPVICVAKKSVAAFKLRAGMPIGGKVTLRGGRMYEFLDRLVQIALPRVRDFKGFSFKGFDGNGNYSFGLKEQIIFPEINYNDIDKIRGMNINICTNAETDQEAKFLLQQFSVPFYN